jgi:hypothetical protein
MRHRGHDWIVGAQTICCHAETGVETQLVWASRSPREECSRYKMALSSSIFYLDSRRRSLSVEAGFILTSTWHQQKEPAWTDIG